MEKGRLNESIANLTTSLHNFDLNNKPNSKYIKPTQNSLPTTLQLSVDFLAIHKQKRRPSLVSLCLGVVGSNLEDIVDDLAEIASTFPSHIKMALAAIARRRKLLNDDVIIALADGSWDILDISGSDVSDLGILQVVKICKNLKAVDVSRCSRLTPTGVSELLQQCDSLEILRWGGCPRSDQTAHGCLCLLKPNLNDGEGESWEELDTTSFTHSVQSLRWLVWPRIDRDSLESLSAECPRIIVNPKPSPLGFRGSKVPEEALAQVVLDDRIVQDIDPKTWTLSRFTSRTTPASTSSPDELSIAEKFRLAFVERDTRLAPKRAKNARQHQRRAEKEWVTMSTRAKALALASQARTSPHLRHF